MRVTAALTEIDNGGWFAHAPCEFTYPVPAGCTRLAGVFGFLSGAYAESASGTDGATFIIEANTSGGGRERLLERRLTPVANPVDRGAIAFDVSLPAKTGTEVRFIIEAGESTNRDWTYWGGLHFKKRP